MPKDFITIDHADKRPEIPELGKAKKCGDEQCPWPKFQDGYGLAGGGMGAYEYCNVCERVVSKTVDPMEDGEM